MKETNRNTSRWYLWAGVIGLLGFTAQFVFSLAVWDRLTFEEIAESIRNPYWISHAEIYDGISSNVVFYKSLDLYYRVAGFNLFAAKEFRLILSFVSILVLVCIACRWAKHRVSAGFALSAAALSPTLLYFGSCQASFGIDLQIFPLAAAIWLASLHAGAVLSAGLLSGVTLVLVLMGAAFPPGLFYLPAILVADLCIHFSRAQELREFSKVAMIRVSAAACGILVGLAIPFLLVENPLTLLYDPNTGSGLFRGGGKPTYHLMPILEAVGRTLSDLFVEGDSYQFQLPHPEFGTPLAWVGIGAMAFVLMKAALVHFPLRSSGLLPLLKRGNFQVALVAGILLATFAVMSHVSPNLPGLRRSAGMLVAFYLFYYVALQLSQSGRLFRSKWASRILLLAMALLPANHLFQLVRNLEELPTYSREGYPAWLMTRASAKESLAALYSEVQAGRPLTCAEVPAGCRYSAPFAALRLTHRNTGEAGELEVYAEDPETGNTIPVERGLWESYYWLH